jgi:Flp pilus assembly protein CpaB
VWTAGAGEPLPALHRGAMGMTRYRRRSIVLGLLAAGLLLAVLVGGGHDARRPPAAMRQLVMLRRPLAAGQRITAQDLATTAAPARWASVHQLSDPAAAIGLRAAAAMPAGVPLIDAMVTELRTRGSARDLSLRLDDAAGLPREPVTGARADVYQVRPGSGRVRLVIADVQVVAAGSADGVATATVRVSPADVPRLIAAETAGSLRLVARIGNA